MTAPAGTRTRILLLTNSVAIGGMEEHVRLLAQHLDRTRFEVLTVIPDDPHLAGFAAALAAASDEVATITPDRRFGIIRHARECARLFRLVRTRRIRVAHLHSTTFGGLWTPSLMCRLGGVRRLFVTEHLAPYGAISWWRRLERGAFGLLVTGTVCVSEKNRTARAERIRTPPRTTTVVPNGIDLDRFSDVPPDAVRDVRQRYGLDGRQVVATVIRLEHDKGMHDLIDAFTVLAKDRPDVRLLIVGDGSLRHELEELARERGVDATVVFAGFAADPRPYLAVTDVFVLPVPEGSASIGLLEAMAMGCPAVISFGGEGEAVVPGVSGWWAEPNDPASIADRVGALLDDDEVRERMGEAARRRVAEDFSAQRVATQFAELYTS